MMFSQQRQHTEYFHLAFLAQLGLRLDKQAYALKGGANLRFFLKSFRYSEDMDFDVGRVSAEKLRPLVAAILRSSKLEAMLAIRGMRIKHMTESKQTGTTQRWKLGLIIPGIELPVPTKIEFSRRRALAGTAFDAVDPELAREHRIAPFFACHYPAEAAWLQKLEALAARSVPQARDVFDMYFLQASGTVLPGKMPTPLTAEALGRARESCLSIGFEDFKSQVLSFFPLEQQKTYDAREVWEEMVRRVLDVVGGCDAAH